MNNIIGKLPETSQKTMIEYFNLDTSNFVLTTCCFISKNEELICSPEDGEIKLSEIKLITLNEFSSHSEL